MRITAVEVFGVERGLPARVRWGTMEVATKGGVLVRVRTEDTDDRIVPSRCSTNGE